MKNKAGNNKRKRESDTKELNGLLENLEKKRMVVLLKDIKELLVKNQPQESQKVECNKKNKQVQANKNSNLDMTEKNERGGPNETKGKDYLQVSKEREMVKTKSAEIIT